jgi:hypothetical protein
MLLHVLALSRSALESAARASVGHLGSGKKRKGVSHGRWGLAHSRVLAQ